MKYAVVELSGKQYVVYPNQVLEVENLGESGKIECDKVILISDNGRVSIGAPYLKDKISINITDGRKTKVRVAKYHAKANTRKVIGHKKITKKVALAA